MSLEHLLEGFPGREAHLARVPRFSLYAVMYWRSSLLSHARHVAWLTRELESEARAAFPSYDPVRAELLALVHDDAELVTGDVQAGTKLKMSPAELRALDEWESFAIDRITRRYPERIGDYSYRDLLEDSLDPHTPEALVVKFADKFDALGETLHEIFGGNLLFLTPVRGEYGLVPTPLEYYRAYWAELPTKNTALRPLLEQDHPMLGPLPDFDERETVATRPAHTIESFQESTGYGPYDLWKKVILKHDEDGAEQRILTTRREDYWIDSDNI